MRGTRWFLILAILGILGGLGATYRLQKRMLAQHAPPKPARMPVELLSSMSKWTWSRTNAAGSKVILTADSARQEKNSGITRLQGVELQIFPKQGDTYDTVKCGEARFTDGDRQIYSDGEVEITMKIPVAGPPKRKPVHIRTSGLKYDLNNSNAGTERAVTFEFENGDGKAVGAVYDPNAKLLHLYHQVELNWKAPGPNSKPMKLEAGELTYQEGSGKIWLTPWAKVTRDSAVIESEVAVATIEDEKIRGVTAAKGHGTDSYPNRKLDYSAGQLTVKFSDRGTVEKVEGEPDARLASTSETSVTTITANRVDLDFAEDKGESVLTHVLAAGNGVAESKPLPVPGKPLPETRVLRSSTIDMKMQPGGKEIQSAEVPQPGTLEFFPNRPAQRHRTLAGAHMWIAYGAENRIQSFRAVDASTRTDPTAEEKARKREPSTTSSRNLSAQFDAKTGQLSRLEQQENFVYQEGDRNARAARAVLEQDQNLITLESGAKMWDATGSTFADRIRLDQRTSNFEAEGHVSSSRQPEQKKPTSELLSGDEPLQAVAERTQSANHNRQVHYQGKAMLWQGANRVQAAEVWIDRDKHQMRAEGNVVTQFVDEQKDDAGQNKPGGQNKPAGPPVFTIVKADKLLYSEENRLAHYTGSATLARPGLDVKAAEIRAFLAEKGADNRLEHAIADGNVSIVQKTLLRTRTGTSEHAEYYTDNERILLRGGAPQLADTQEGITRGVELTYFVDDNRLISSGGPGRPAAARVRVKKK
jgi:lipopolysaccharide export system protein LptA